MSHEPFRVSKRLVEIWEIRDAIAQKVAHLPTDQALAEIMRMAAESSKSIDLPRSDPRISTKQSALGKVS
jgi:hypothetical protein